MGSIASYVYDADGNRVSSTGTTTNYVVDTSLLYASVVEEYNGTTLTVWYDYGDDLVRMDRGSRVYYYLYDGLGSTRQLVNPAGTVTGSYGNSTFGEMVLHTGSTVNPFLFNARHLLLQEGRRRGLGLVPGREGGFAACLEPAPPAQEQALRDLMPAAELGKPLLTALDLAAQAELELPREGAR